MWNSENLVNEVVPRQWQIDKMWFCFIAAPYEEDAYVFSSDGTF